MEQRERPELRGRAVVVGGLGARGVVAAASYEARDFGIHSAMPTTRARRLCPDAEFVAPRIDLYAAVSRDVMAILRRRRHSWSRCRSTRRSSTSRGHAVARLGTRDRVDAASPHPRRVALTASVGVATTKMLAKIASDVSKPDGLLVIEPGTELAFLHPLPVRRLWGVGPATQRKLTGLGVATVGELSRVPDRSWSTSSARRWAPPDALRTTVTRAAVEPNRVAKSIGHEETFATDRDDRRGLEQDVLRMADRVAARLREHDKVARTVQLKLRYRDFATITAPTRFPSPPISPPPSGGGARAARRRRPARRHPAARRHRAGARGCGRGAGAAAVGDRVGCGVGRRTRRRARAHDRRRAGAFGTDAVGRAAHAVDGRVRTDRRGSLWGPDDTGGPFGVAAGRRGVTCCASR